MAIPDSFIDELVARSDILEIVSRYVEMKRSGANYFGRCPFHNEKTPSFSVSPERQIYHCFGCGAGGGVIGFVMRIENTDFTGAVQLLAGWAGMRMPDETQADDEARRRRERIFALNKEAARFFHEQLTLPGSPGAPYLAARGLSAKTVRSFGLGWAPDSWDSLIKAMTAKGFTKDELLAARLASKSRNGNICDLFRARVMFPIIDERGRVVAFGGRIIGEGGPKYLNSPETPVFSKSRTLFALNLAKQTSSRRYILAEGYMDVVSLHQGGFGTAVASLGTSLTEEQAKLLSRYADEIVIAYDGDQAGVAATGRAIEILKKTGLKIKVLHITGAKDPDEYIKKNGPEALARLMDSSENHIEYRLEAAADGCDLSSDDGKVTFMKRAVNILAGVDNDVEREIYAAKAAAAGGVSVSSVMTEVRRETAARRKKSIRDDRRRASSPTRLAQPRERSVRYENIRSGLAEEEIVSACFTWPEITEKAAGMISAEDFSSPQLSEIFSRLIEMARSGRRPSLDTLSAGMDTPWAEHLASVLSKSPPLDPERTVADCASIIRTEALKKGGADDFEAAASIYRDKKKGYGGAVQ